MIIGYTGIDLPQGKVKYNDENLLSLVEKDKPKKVSPYFFEFVLEDYIHSFAIAVKKENILSGRKMRGFRIVEKYFTILSLTIFFCLKIKSDRIKKIYYNLGNELISLLSKRQLNGKALRPWLPSN